MKTNDPRTDLYWEFENQRLKIMYPKATWQLKNNILSFEVKKERKVFRQAVRVNFSILPKAIKILEESLKKTAVAYFTGKIK